MRLTMLSEFGTLERERMSEEGREGIIMVTTTANNTRNEREGRYPKLAVKVVILVSCECCNGVEC